MDEVIPSTSMKVCVKDKIIHSQGQTIISNALKFMKEEAASNTPTIPLTHFKERLLAATGISDITYRSMVKEAEDVYSGRVVFFSSPGKTRIRPSPKSNFPNEDKETIVHNIYIHDRRQPTLRGIYSKIHENSILFEGGLTTLSNI